MKNIVLLRVDERLLHGQTLTKWMNATNANNILLVDEELPKNQFQCKIFNSIKPHGTTLEIMTPADAAEWLKGDSADERVMVLCKYVDAANALIQAGIKAPKNTVIFGAAGKTMDPTRNRKNHLIRDLYASDDEVAGIKALGAAGVQAVYQLASDAKPINLLEKV